MADCIVLHPDDNVATVLRKVAGGDTLVVADQGLNSIGRITAAEEIPFAHKISLKEIGPGEPIIKYGERIGRASAQIAQGGYVHIHNVVSVEGTQRAAAGQPGGKEG